MVTEGLMHADDPARPVKPKSRLERLGLRQESTPSRDPYNEYASRNRGKTAAPTFVPALITEKIEDKNNLEHRARVAAEDPLAKYIVSALAVNTFDDWFVLVDDDGKEIPENKEIQRKLLDLDAQFIWTQCLKVMRGEGQCWQYIAKGKSGEDGATSKQVARYDYFSSRELTVSKYKKNGTPELLQLLIKIEGQTEPVKEIYPVEDFILWNFDPISRRSWQGYPATYGAWDAMTELRLAFNAITWYVMKVGMGAWVIELKKTVDDAEATAIQNMFQALGPRTVAMVNKDKTEDIDFKGGSMSTSSFAEIFDGLLGRVSAATGIPKDMYIGAFAGKITGSDVVLKSLYQVLNGIQTNAERPIRDNIKRLGPKYENLYFRFKWNVKFIPDAEQEAKISFLKTEEFGILAAMGTLTINELREKMGMVPLPDGQGDELTNAVRVAVGPDPSSSAEKKDKDQNTTKERV